MVTHCNLTRLRFLDGSVGVFVGITDTWRATFTWGPLLVEILVENEGKEAPWRLSFDSAPSALF